MMYREFIISLNKYLFNTEDCDNNLIRKHTRNLEKAGEFSFSFDRIPICTTREEINKFNNVNEIGQLLITESEKWLLQISKCNILDNSNVHIFLERASCFKKIINKVLKEGKSYGSQRSNFSKCVDILVNTDESNINQLNLNQLRMVLLKNVIVKLLEFNYCNNEENLNKVVIYVCLNLDKNSTRTIIQSGPVLCIKDGQKCIISSEEFYRKRTIDMRLMAEHKYGLRITAQPGWEEFFEKLGQAAVTIDLMQSKCNRAVTINLNDATSGNSKGASFILYNCARLATLFKELDKKIASGIYPELPSLESVAPNLLNQPEEWELLFTYVLQFPFVVNNCVKDLLDGRFNIHYLCNMLSGMCSVFSVYYRRVRILTEPRDHLFPVLHARIYLLKSVEQVLHNGLHLLDIQPVKQM